MSTTALSDSLPSSDAVEAKGFWGHFDGMANSEKLEKWEKDEHSVKSLLMQKLPDSALMPVQNKPTVHEHWGIIIFQMPGWQDLIAATHYMSKEEVDPDPLIYLISKENTCQLTQRLYYGCCNQDLCTNSNNKALAATSSSSEASQAAGSRKHTGACHYCKQDSHWKRGCPELKVKGSGLANAIEEFDEDSDVSGAFMAMADEDDKMLELIDVSDSEDNCDNSNNESDRDILFGDEATVEGLFGALVLDEIASAFDNNLDSEGEEESAAVTTESTSTQADI
ncbi:hypothetical protein BDN71DRAFT_1428359 [Pleurotus eryngii]|uniref:CCHC-type domain-containing protein n=1 Tax=Pleurotus eryngii TaxID=5323 RepID=A0A9P6A319_PLEER|nr:hypothetical protein BDN71DRAFT_1428359 [Pleurotus eryngii]